MAKERNRLFYLAGAQPTAEESATAAALGMVRFRNAALVGETDSLEFADEVAGKVPAGYAKMEGCKIVQPRSDGEAEAKAKAEAEAKAKAEADMQAQNAKRR